MRSFLHLTSFQVYNVILLVIFAIIVNPINDLLILMDKRLSNRNHGHFDKWIEIVRSLSEKNTSDGIKFTWDDSWIHLRKSNTEPIMRIYAEAPDELRAIKLVDEIKNLI